MDAETELHLLLTQLKAWLSDRGRGPRRERDPHRTEGRNSCLADGDQLRQVFTLGGGGTQQLVNEYRAGKTARPGGLRRASQGHIIIHHDHLDGNAFRARHLRRQTEVQAVAGIVLDHQQGPWLSRNRFDGSKNGVAAG